MRKIRLITTDELRLLNQILKNVHQSRKDRFFYVYEVVTLNDGGMGSFCFYYNNGVDPGKLEDKVYAIGEIEFFDIDNVGCLATLYVYNDNRVAELDIWFFAAKANSKVFLIALIPTNYFSATKEQFYL